MATSRTFGNLVGRRGDRCGLPRPRTSTCSLQHRATEVLHTGHSNASSLQREGRGRVEGRDGTGSAKSEAGQKLEPHLLCHYQLLLRAVQHTHSQIHEA